MNVTFIFEVSISYLPGNRQYSSLALQKALETLLPTACIVFFTLALHGARTKLNYLPRRLTG